MSLKMTTLWANASWRESARARAAEVDLDHLYLGLLALGGSAARLLGQHGITLASARQRAREALADDLAALGLPEATAPPPITLRNLGDAGFDLTPRAKVVADKAMKAPDTYGVLVALLQEESGTVRRLVHADGVTPQDLVPELKQGADDAYSAEKVPVESGLLTEPAHASQLSTFISVPPSAVAGVLADPDALHLWAIDPQRSTVRDDGETVEHIRGGSKTITLRYHHKRQRTDDAEIVTWIAEILDGPHAGESLMYERFEVRPAPGGTNLTRISGRRRFGLLGRIMAPLWDSFSDWGMVHSTQVIAFGVAERQGD